MTTNEAAAVAKELQEMLAKRGLPASDQVLIFWYALGLAKAHRRIEDIEAQAGAENAMPAARAGCDG